MYLGMRMINKPILLYITDVINLTYKQADVVDLLKKGIAWDSDKDFKFKNPPIPDGKTLKDVLENKTVKPEAWRKELWELDLVDKENNGLQNEDLIVWMRTAAFPNFRKLYRRINHTGSFATGLPKGNYTFSIDYSKFHFLKKRSNVKLYFLTIMGVQWQLLTGSG
jgi:hypothetical protein